MEQWAERLQGFLTDPGWAGVLASALVCAVTVGVMIVIFQRQQERKGLSYEILTLTPLAIVEEGHNSEVEIRYAGEPVEDVSLITLRIVNSGNVPITEDDYEFPVTFTFGKDAKLLSAEVLETSPEALKRNGRIAALKNKLLLGMFLLNAGDWVDVKLLVAGFGGQMEVDGRIVGVKDITVVKERRSYWFLLTAMLVLLTAMAWSVVGGVLMRLVGVQEMWVPVWIGAFFGGLVMVLTVASNISRSG